MNMFFACAEHLNWGVMLVVLGFAAGLWLVARRLEMQ